MAFGRQKAGDNQSDDGNMVPEAEVRAIVEAAIRARDSGRRIFTCSVTVEFTTGSGLGMGGKRSTQVRRWDPAVMIEEVEALGWRLEHLDHVWEQTEHNNALGGAAMIRGLTVAHLLFRMGERP
ncbi:hypothetical protein O2W15_02125 [Modestobacter sp. VKM Ac-2979]|uniref:hypothetical protein n=1 Tax=unclassified Modestobacter TaxID=2643866 RepID=UPI0022AB71FC|nr:MULTISPECIES: hypothetical protein [unclassified Modestobacter]MCZ2810223.1 hypothetical protein [Modestobacter sp. VKM Ac-2979]MCZ2841709.1 hypothetical protein [Modestobacter sp. VKM Ac-2980]